jgi:hypothetical protein
VVTGTVALFLTDSWPVFALSLLCRYLTQYVEDEGLEDDVIWRLPQVELVYTVATRKEASHLLLVPVLSQQLPLPLPLLLSITTTV